MTIFSIMMSVLSFLVLGPIALALGIFVVMFAVIYFTLFLDKMLKNKNVINRRQDK